FFMLISEDDLDIPDSDLTEIPVEPSSDTIAPPTEALLSLHAMSGYSTHNTFRIMGTIAKQQVTILVDSGSTHNFVQDRVAKFLGLPITPAPQPFRVMVGNGDTLDCATQCVGVQFNIQGNHFTSDFFVLPLGGAEVVLGVP
ncbi:hypothetical protein A2U01_0043270, partial [Trifolium medium]|nr:hypothetical protein [Trifolium medium]